jgi:hypothetical protein
LRLHEPLEIELIAHSALPLSPECYNATVVC